MLISICSQDSDFFRKYKLQPTTLGEGAYSICIKCKRRSDSKEFAVKIFNSNYDIENELKFLKLCKGHASIVELIETFHDNNYTYIVMEYLAGGDVASRKKISANDLTSITLQLLEGVLHIHRKGLAHCDIKPENILFVDKSSTEIKIIDFGSAMYVEPRPIDDEQPPCFTLDYAPPEIIASKYLRETSESNSCDLWSLGATLYKIACERLPFRNKETETHQQIAERISQGKYNTTIKAWHNLKHTLKQVIQNLLRVIPQDRATLPKLISMLAATSSSSAAAAATTAVATGTRLSSQLPPNQSVQLDQLTEPNIVAEQQTNASHAKSTSIDYNCNRKTPTTAAAADATASNMELLHGNTEPQSMGKSLESRRMSIEIESDFCGFADLNVFCGVNCDSINKLEAIFKSETETIKKTTIYSQSLSYHFVCNRMNLSNEIKMETTAAILVRKRGRLVGFFFTTLMNS